MHRARSSSASGPRKIVAGPGDDVVVPAGKVHAFANVGGEEAQGPRAGRRPRSTWSACSRRPSRSPRRARTNRKGMPKPLHLALFVRRFRREVRAPFPPAPIVAAMLAPLALDRDARGHGERYGETVAAEPAIVAVTA